MSWQDINTCLPTGTTLMSVYRCRPHRETYVHRFSVKDLRVPHLDRRANLYRVGNFGVDLHTSSGLMGPDVRLNRGRTGLLIGLDRQRTFCVARHFPFSATHDASSRLHVQRHVEEGEKKKKSPNKSNTRMTCKETNGDGDGDGDGDGEHARAGDLTP